MHLHLLPIEKTGQRRLPRYLKARGQSGLDIRWAMMDFGHTSEIALVGSDAPIRAPDVLRLPVAWSQTDRDRLGGYLRSAGIEPDWVSRAKDWREAWHRVAGLAQTYQSAMDDSHISAKLQDPSAWLGRYVHFGFDSLAPLDWQAYMRERESKRWKIGDWRLFGREWVNQVTGRVIPVIMGGALPATDVFTRTGAPEVSIETYSANWTLNAGDLSVYAVTDDVSGSATSSECGAFWNADTFSADHYSQGVINAMSSASAAIGVGARHNTSATENYYMWYSETAASYLGKNIGGSWTQLGSNGTAFAASDVVLIEANGTSITGKIDTVTEVGPITDSSLSTGAAGLSAYSTDASPNRIDNWEGGNLGAAATSIAFENRSRRIQNLLAR